MGNITNGIQAVSFDLRIHSDHMPNEIKNNAYTGHQVVVQIKSGFKLSSSLIIFYKQLYFNC